MKTQTHLSELDAIKLANLRLRQQLLINESQAFEAYLFATYGNPGETMTITEDNAIVRKSQEKPKGKRKP